MMVEALGNSTEHTPGAWMQTLRHMYVCFYVLCPLMDLMGILGTSDMSCFNGGYY